MARIKHYFPGGNTSSGFFSYYDDVVYNKSNKKVYILKGGPGCGKSTLMKRIGHEFEKKALDVEYLRCSGDVKSIDGVKVPGRGILMVDGTSPHILDPKNPGAVETVLNLGAFWNEKAIEKERALIEETNGKIKSAYAKGYSYLAASKVIYDSIDAQYHGSFRDLEILRIADSICKKEMGIYDISVKKGEEIRGFASAITHDGTVNYVKSILECMKKIYILKSPCCFRINNFLEVIKNYAVVRGFDCESYYCPMSPQNNIEHIVIPELSLAITTVNKYHDLSPWELYQNENEDKKINVVDINEYIGDFENMFEALYDDMTLFQTLIKKSINSFEIAKAKHDKLETIYTSSMNFEKCNNLIDKVVESIV